ncbi:MAG: aldolase/citrate lyase family protein [Saprospiraceae bacterium]
MISSFAHKLSQGQCLFGTLITLPALEISEMAANAGFDWLFIDMEHSALGIKEVQQHLMAAKKTHCFVRVPAHSEEWSKRVLDAGAHGIIFPNVQKADEVRNIISWCRYPPVGNRSAGLSRAQGFGQHVTEYFESANSALNIIIQIEHINALPHLEELAEMKSIDAWFIGPYDLMMSMKKENSKVSPEAVEDNIQAIFEVARNHRIPCGIYAPDLLITQQRLKQGFHMIATGIDSSILSNHYRHLLNTLKIK